MRVVVGISGASGSILGIRLLEELDRNDVETHLIISSVAKDIIEYETDYSVKDVENLASFVHDENDLNAIVNSGSFKFDASVIIPCSMKTLSSISNAYGDNVISRVGDVTLKERRKTDNCSKRNTAENCTSGKHDQTEQGRSYYFTCNAWILP